MLEGTKDRIERIRFLRRIDANEALRQDLYSVNRRLLTQNFTMSEKVIKLQEKLGEEQKKMEQRNINYYSMKKRLRREEMEKLAFIRKNTELRDSIKALQKQLQEEIIKNARLDAQVSQALDLLEKEKQSKLRKRWRSTREWFRGIMRTKLRL